MMLSIWFLQFCQFFGNFFSFSKKDKKDQQQIKVSDKKNLLCRFVLDSSGKKVGETVAVVDEDILIIKSGCQFLGVPLKHVEENGKTILVKGLIDYTKACELGETWRETATRDA
ncbi:MAG: DUF5749 family beta-barrel protein [Candidatus Thermoplasmatota archaeon]